MKARALYLEAQLNLLLHRYGAEEIRRVLGNLTSGRPRIDAANLFHVLLAVEHYRRCESGATVSTACAALGKHGRKVLTAYRINTKPKGSIMLTQLDGIPGGINIICGPAETIRRDYNRAKARMKADAHLREAWEFAIR